MNLTFDLLGEELGSPARRNKQKSYASLRLTTRFRVGSLSNGRDIRPQHIRNVPCPARALVACNGWRKAGCADLDRSASRLKDAALRGQFNSTGLLVK